MMINKEKLNAIDVSDCPEGFTEIAWRIRKYRQQYGYMLEDFSVEPIFGSAIHNHFPDAVLRSDKGISVTTFHDELGTMGYLFLTNDAKERIRNLIDKYPEMLSERGVVQMTALLAYLDLC